MLKSFRSRGVFEGLLCELDMRRGRKGRGLYHWENGGILEISPPPLWGRGAVNRLYIYVWERASKVHFWSLVSFPIIEYTHPFIL